MNEVLQSISQHALPVTDALQRSIERYLKNKTKAVLGISGAVTAYWITKLIVYRLYAHPLRHLPGPKVGWFPFMGNFLEILKEEAGVPHKRWAAEYGGIFLYHGPWNDPRVAVTDSRWLKQVLTTQVYDFIKPPGSSEFLRKFLGDGLLVAEGDEHRFQRKVLNPAFSVTAIRSMVPQIAQPGLELRQHWLGQLKEDVATELQISSDLSMTTLDVIGLAGFGQDFGSLRYAGTAQQSKLSQAYLAIFSNDASLLRVLSFLFPVLRYLPTERNRMIKRHLDWLNEESMALVQAGIQRGANEKKGQAPKDLLSLMVNLIDDETGKGLTAEQLKHQCLTFLAAGHETTSVSLSWCLWLLAKHPEIQDRLRAEVKEVFKGEEIPTYDEINKLTLLDNVCRETLRLIPPVPITNRMTRVPVTLGPYVLPKGTQVFLPLIVGQHDPQIWGEDAEEFNPDRWTSEMVGNAYQYLPFLAGGRQCIGYKFAQIEMKILLALLIKDIQYFEKPDFKITKKQQITLRPYPNMTLLMKRV
ncbi:cytochrome P450 [Sporodiniella umbellata]|nr:cytochrome P450 [Sporodiniella umbellata]